MRSVSKNVSLDKLADILIKYNNTYHCTIKQKHVDMKSRTHIDLKNNEKRRI